MRARDIKPGFYKNDELAECSLMARFIFPGLWMIADREGRFEDRPKRIKAELLPYDDADMDALLDELHDHGLIIRYVVDGAKYICIPKFSAHQRPHTNEKGSEIPPCPQTGTQEGFDDKGEQKEQPKSEVVPTKETSDDDQGEQDLSPREEALVTKVASTCHQGSKHLSPRKQALRPSSLSPSSLSPSYLDNNINIYTPIGSLVNEDRAREEDSPRGGKKADLPDLPAEQPLDPVMLDGPGMEFVELRDFYTREVRAEGPLDGFAEYKQLKAARDRTGASHWPGLDRICNDLATRKATGFWNPGYEFGLARYLKTRLWLGPTQKRVEPKPATPTEHQRRQQESRNMARMVLEFREQARAGQEAGYAAAIDA